MTGDERLRLFLALRLPEPELDVLEAWQGKHLPSGYRIVPRSNLHVTLAFLGHRPAGELPAILAELRDAAAGLGELPRLTALRYRETRSVGMLVLDDEDGRAERLARDVQGRLERLGVYRSEARRWLPHVTVARFRKPEGLRPELPNRGTYVLIPSDASAYLSRLRPPQTKAQRHPGGQNRDPAFGPGLAPGAQYEILESFALGA